MFQLTAESLTNYGVAYVVSGLVLGSVIHIVTIPVATFWGFVRTLVFSSPGPRSR